MLTSSLIADYNAVQRLLLVDAALLVVVNGGRIHTRLNASLCTTTTTRGVGTTYGCVVTQQKS